VARLETLSEEEVSFLVECSATDRVHLLWSAVSRRYSFIQEFARDVLREHFVLMRRQILLSDFDAFYNQKALWHPELDQLAKSTQSKLRQNLFRMMRDAGYINDQYTIAPAMLTPALAQLLAKNGGASLLIFPVSDLDIKRWLQ
jgi:predicted 3-demethylubiquinone-9 3-methyltransferase (glyoxalase superfamily)